MTPRDPELLELLISECERHGEQLRTEGDQPAVLRRVLHTIRGAAAVAGERALADAFARLERASDHAEARAAALETLQMALENLRAGRNALLDTWPVPPADLAASDLPVDLIGCYASEMRERVAGLDAVVVESRDPVAALEGALRLAHGMKGAAGAMGDEPLLWFCHGLETRLQQGLEGRGAALLALDELSMWRSVLMQMAENPARAIDVLRARTAGTAASVVEPLRKTAPPAAGSGSEPPDQGWLHVPTSALDRVLERLRLVSALSRESVRHADVARSSARLVRNARTDLMDARRLIGPPRPWGVPAAAIQRIREAETRLMQVATSIDRLASSSREHARAVHKTTLSSQLDLEGLRRAAMEIVFDKVRASVEAMADRHGGSVRVETRGGATAVDRRLADALVDPVLQLARNAVAHGIEPSRQREAAGKPAKGCVTLSAETRGAHLIVTVEDDGAGVDIDTLRARALETGLVTEQTAREADDEALVHLVFLPGLTTRKAADLLAGRGVGLDLALHAVRRLGGTIRMVNRPARGLKAVIDVPLVERGSIRVLWVSTGAHRVALPARHVLRIHPRSAFPELPRSLASWLDPRRPAVDDGVVLELGSGDPRHGASLSCTVHSVESIEETSVRPVPPLVATAGPYVGVIPTADGTPALLIDGLMLVETARLGAEADPGAPAQPSRSDAADR